MGDAPFASWASVCLRQACKSEDLRLAIGMCNDDQGKQEVEGRLLGELHPHRLQSAAEGIED